MNRFNRWRKAGVRDRLLQAVSKAYDGKLQMIDMSSIRVHQHAANGQKKRRDRINLPPFNKGLYPIAIWLSASSINSNTFVPSQPVTISATTTTSPPSNWHQSVFGCDLMSW